MSKQAPIEVQKGFPTDPEDAQRRMIMASFKREDGSVIKVMNGYFPRGEPGSRDQVPGQAEVL